MTFAFGHNNRFESESKASADNEVSLPTDASLQDLYDQIKNLTSNKKFAYPPTWLSTCKAS